MSRYIDADAHVARMRELYCKDCSRRKGMKNGKMKFIYPIGGVPCRACAFGDALDDIDDAPTVDAVPVVRCKDCERWGSPIPNEMKEEGYGYCGVLWTNTHENEYCAWGKRRTE